MKTLIIRFKDGDCKTYSICELLFTGSQIKIETKDEILFFNITEVDTFAILK